MNMETPELKLRTVFFFMFIWSTSIYYIYGNIIKTSDLFFLLCFNTEKRKIEQKKKKKRNIEKTCFIVSYVRNLKTSSIARNKSFFYCNSITITYFSED